MSEEQDQVSILVWDFKVPYALEENPVIQNTEAGR